MKMLMQFQVPGTRRHEVAAAREGIGAEGDARFGDWESMRRGVGEWLRLLRNADVRGGNLSAEFSGGGLLGGNLTAEFTVGRLLGQIVTA